MASVRRPDLPRRRRGQFAEEEAGAERAGRTPPQTGMRMSGPEELARQWGARTKPGTGSVYQLTPCPLSARECHCSEPCEWTKFALVPVRGVQPQPQRKPGA